MSHPPRAPEEEELGGDLESTAETTHSDPAILQMVGQTEAQREQRPAQGARTRWWARTVGAGLPLGLRMWGGLPLSLIACLFCSLTPCLSLLSVLLAQDTLGGRFDATQAFVGDIAQFNLWDHALTPAQVLGIANCTGLLLGNVLPWEDKLVEAFGGATKAAFDVCKGRAKA